MSKAIFLDRDGVINVDKEYIFKIEDLEFIDGSLEALKKLQTLGYILIIVTNQSGIGRGYYKEEDYLELKKELHSLLEKNKIKVSEEYYCKHSPEDNCLCRKPSIFFIKDAEKKYQIDLEKSYFIGDKTSDILAGKRAGLKTVLVKTGKAGKDGKYDIMPNFKVENLLEASNLIEELE